MSKQTLPPQLPQGGGSFVRQPDGGLVQVEKPTADPIPKPATPTAKPGSKKETK